MNNFTSDKVIRLFNSPQEALGLSLQQWAHFIFILRENDLLARFHYLSKNDNSILSFPKQVVHHLHSAHIKAKRQAKQARFEATELHNNLKTIDVTPVFLKGVAYTLRDSSASIGRIYSDMDILVQKNDLRDIEKKLSFSGWFTQQLDNYDQRYYREWAHEIPPMQQASRGTIADIHHNLLPPISGRAPDINIFIKNPHITKEGLYTLSHHAMVLHSIIHLFFNEDFKNGFRDLSDLHIMFSEVDKKQKFWDDLHHLAIDSNFEVELFYALRYCQRINNTSFPQSFVNAVNNATPNRTSLIFADFIFINVLAPLHPSLSDFKTKIAVFCAIIRGHLLKMPLHILIFHSTHKFVDHIYKIFKNENKGKKMQNINDEIK